jgi:hypothetical protein
MLPRYRVSRGQTFVRGALFGEKLSGEELSGEELIRKELTVIQEINTLNFVYGKQ